MKICLDCGRIAPRNRCSACQQAHNRRHNAKLAAKTKASGRGTSAWRKLRAAALERDGHQCRRCGSTRYLSGHLNPALGGNHWVATLEDVTTLCASCHGSLDAPRAVRRRPVG